LQSHEDNDELPITNYQLPVTNNQLPVTNNQLPVTNNQLRMSRSGRWLAQDYVEEPDIIYRDHTSGRLQRLSVDMARAVRPLCLDIWRVHVADRSSIDQMHRAGLSVGANVREAQHAESPRDFVHKLKIAEKELNEFYYWLGILRAHPAILNTDDTAQIEDMALQIKKLLTKIIVTMKLKHGLK
jgi:four helix bundle protein